MAMVCSVNVIESAPMNLKSFALSLLEEFRESDGFDRLSPNGAFKNVFADSIADR